MKRQNSLPSTVQSLECIKEPQAIIISFSKFYEIDYHNQKNILQYVLKLNPSHIPFLEQHLQQINLNGPKQQNKLQQSKKEVLDLEASVIQKLAKIKAFRSSISVLRTNCYQKQVTFRAKMIKKRNLQQVAQQLNNLKVLRTKLTKSKEYGQILQMLKKSLLIPYKIYQPICISRLTELLVQQIEQDKPIKCKQQWGIEEANFLFICLNKIFGMTDLPVRQRNIKKLCLRLIRMLSHVRIKKIDEKFIMLQIKQMFKDKFFSKQIQKSFNLYQQSLSIMQSNNFSVKLIGQINQEIVNQKQSYINLSFKELETVKVLHQEDLRDWIKRIENDYSWISQHGVTRQIEKAKFLITKKIYNSLFLDLKHDRKYHAQRIFSLSKELYHQLHPYKRNNQKFTAFQINFKQNTNQQYLNSRNLMIFRSVQRNDCKNLIDFLDYGKMLHFLWSRDFHQEEVLFIWTNLVSEYIFRVEPNTISQLKQKHCFLHQQIIAKYEQLKVASMKINLVVNQKQEIDTLSKKLPKEERRSLNFQYLKVNQKAYDQVIKNKLSYFDKNKIDQLCSIADSSSECLKQIQHIRARAYKIFFKDCNICLKDHKF